jgi:glucose uptake protein GlcU
MFNLAVVLIAFGAVIGLTMAIQHFKGRTPPSPALAALHGVLVVSGVIVLLLAVREAGFGGAVTWSLVIFGIVALGGLYLLGHHQRRRPLPNGVVIIHGLGAVIAFLILLTAVYLLP